MFGRTLDTVLNNFMCGILVSIKRIYLFYDLIKKVSDKYILSITIVTFNMPYCSAFGCNSRQLKGCGLHFHQFPKMST